MDDHRRIASAIAAGDGDAAETVMREHLRRAYSLGLRSKDRGENAEPEQPRPARKPARRTKAVS